MSTFFASKISRSVCRLLTIAPVLLALPAGATYKPLETNEEQSMPPSRSEISPKHKWNVEALYSDPSLWMQDLSYIKGTEGSPRWPDLKGYQGRLSDPKSMAAFLELYLTLDRKLSKLATYAHLRLDEDLGNDDFKRNYGLITSINHDFRMETSWLEPEILALTDQEITRLMGESA